MGVDMLFLDESLQDERFRRKAEQQHLALILKSYQESAKPILTELFLFRHTANCLLWRIETNSYMTAEVSAIRSTIKDSSQEAQRVMLTIRLERDVTVCVSMFNPLACLHNKFESYGSEPNIVLGGGLFLNLTSGIHIYCDSETVGKEKFDNCQRNKVVKLSSSNEKIIWNRVGGTGMDMRSTAKEL
ncbi:PREDICTED: uncharacterized protein LOC106333700 isoform X3 [Brassica oleracea var. oleracea]|uniref:uncharacterized protein LOC106333700 isoform X3 n=1 Tax=Brassica oleracea var. oleracea TaxID=109376 RepID=UPI0006A6C08B|nr:PREDICTED: uncharacterized protein LOC106333700 isoform X3 [Brassica oleracea var. oleracea]